MGNKEKIFIYGTLADPEVQKRVWGRVTRHTADRLKGYKKVQIEIADETFPALIPGDGSIDGFVMEVSEDELKKIDEYETKAYKRKKVRLVSGQLVWVYVKS